MAGIPMIATGLFNQRTRRCLVGNWSDGGEKLGALDLNLRRHRRTQGEKC